MQIPHTHTRVCAEAGAAAREVGWSHLEVHVLVARLLAHLLHRLAAPLGVAAHHEQRGATGRQLLRARAQRMAVAVAAGVVVVVVEVVTGGLGGS